MVGVHALHTGVLGLLGFVWGEEIGAIPSCAQEPCLCTSGGAQWLHMGCHGSNPGWQCARQDIVVPVLFL